jgi:hypothetical protein
MSPAKVCPKHLKPFPCGSCRIESARRPPQKPVPARPRPKERVLAPVEQVVCMRHAKPHPCPRCVEEEVWAMKFDEQTQLAKLINETLGTTWSRVAQHVKVSPVPQVGDWSKIDEAYNTETYRKEINTGLRYARKLLKNFADSWQGFDDLRQIVDIEIWMATTKYKDKMNGAIAYTIAKNQAQRFLKNQINEQTVTLENPDGTPVINEFGEQVKITRFMSFDDKGLNEEGEPAETSAVENRISIERAEAANEDKWIDLIVGENISALEALVRTWFGAKRAVGEAILKNPECTVRDIPGVPKSTAARVRKAVIVEFRAAIGREWDKTTARGHSNNRADPDCRGLNVETSGTNSGLPDILDIVDNYGAVPLELNPYQL